MAKGPKIPLRVKQIIVHKALENRKTPRALVAKDLKDIIEAIGEVVPADDTLEKMISWARNHAPHPEDARWSLGALAQYDIPPDALPSVMRVWAERLRGDDPLTIREAKWIGRLHTITNPPAFVGDWAYVYAFRERVCWILDRPFDSTGLDIPFVNFHRRQTTRLGHLFPISPLYLALPKEDEELLEKRGYKIEYDLNSEEANNERTHKKAKQE